jgi:hypothetical protein
MKDTPDRTRSKAEAIATMYGPEERRTTGRLAGMIACACYPAQPGRKAKDAPEPGPEDKISFTRFASIAQTSVPVVSRHYKAWERAADAGHVPHAAELRPSDWAGKLMRQVALLEDHWSFVLCGKVEKRAVTLAATVVAEVNPPADGDQREYNALVDTLSLPRARQIVERYAGSHFELPAAGVITSDRELLQASAAVAALKKEQPPRNVRLEEEAAEHMSAPEQLVHMPGGSGELVSVDVAEGVLLAEAEMAMALQPITAKIATLQKNVTALLEMPPDSKLHAYWSPGVAQALELTDLLSRTLWQLQSQLEAGKNKNKPGGGKPRREAAATEDAAPAAGQPGTTGPSSAAADMHDAAGGAGRRRRGAARPREQARPRGDAAGGTTELLARLNRSLADSESARSHARRPAGE